MLLFLATVLLLAADGGDADAGTWWAPQRRAVPAPRPAEPPKQGSSRFITFDGQHRFDGGFTDELTLEVGGCAYVAFPRRVVSIVCDDPFVRLDAEENAFRFEGLAVGTTACGIWFSPKEPPGRYFRIEVTRAKRDGGTAECIWPSARPTQSD